MARYIVCTIVLVLCVCGMRSQVRLLVSPYIGRTFTTTSFRQLGSLAFPARSTGLSALSGITYGTTLGAEFPLSSTLFLQATTGYGASTVNLSTSEPTAFAVNGVVVPGTFEHVYSISNTAFEVSAALGIQLHKQVAARATGGLYVQNTLYGTQRTSITEPSNVTFEGGATTREVRENNIQERRGIIPFVGLSIIIPTQPFASVGIDPELCVRTNLTSAATVATINYSQVFVKVNVRFGSANTADAEILAELQQIQEVQPLPELATKDVVPKPLTTAPLITIRSDTTTAKNIPAVYSRCKVQFAGSDGKRQEFATVHVRKSLRYSVFQTASGITQKRVDTIIQANPPIIVLIPEVSSDDIIKKWHCTVRLADTTLFVAEGIGDPPVELLYRCNNISAEVFQLLMNDSASVRFEAVGLLGGRTVATESKIHFSKRRQSILVDTSEVEVILVGYDVNQTELPKWTLQTLENIRTLSNSFSHAIIYGLADDVGEQSRNEEIARLRAKNAKTVLKLPLHVETVVANPKHDDVPTNMRGVKIILRKE